MAAATGRRSWAGGRPPSRLGHPDAPTSGGGGEARLRLRFTTLGDRRIYGLLTRRSPPYIHSPRRMTVEGCKGPFRQLLGRLAAGRAAASPTTGSGRLVMSARANRRPRACSGALRGPARVAPRATGR